MKYRFMTTTIALLVTATASAQIYRCEADGVVAFSDRPCGPDSALHESNDGVSFVTPDEHLPALAEAAQEFIRQRRERLARRAATKEPAISAVSAPPARSQTLYVPWPVSGHSGHRRHFEGNAGAPPDIAGHNRYSPLAGPILGTRRDSWLFESTHRRSDDRHRQ